MSLYEGVIPNFSPENIVLWLRHSILILLFIYLHDPIQTCLQLNWTRLVKYCRCINKYSFLGFECWYVFYHYSAQFMMKIRSRLTHCIKRLWDKKKKGSHTKGSWMRCLRLPEEAKLCQYTVIVRTRLNELTPPHRQHAPFRLNRQRARLGSDKRMSSQSNVMFLNHLALVIKESVKEYPFKAGSER